MSFIKHFPPCESWSLAIVAKDLATAPRQYVLKEVRKCTGVVGVENKVIEIVERYGGNSKASDSIINLVEEDLMAYLPFDDERTAKSYAELIHEGAFTPVNEKEAKAVREALIKVVKKYPSSGSV